MPHRELLTELQRLSFQAPASDEREMVRHYTFGSEDLALINRRRGDANRLGFALMLCYLRFPGRILQQGEQPPDPGFEAGNLFLVLDRILPDWISVRNKNLDVRTYPLGDGQRSFRLGATDKVCCSYGRPYIEN